MTSEDFLNEHFKTAKTLLDENSFISSGCPVIDEALKGGFSTQGITQIYGQAGSGKSQIALQLCLSVQNMKSDDNTQFGIVFVCTEAAFPVRRLQQLLLKSPLCNEKSISTDRIFIEHINTVDDLEQYLCVKLPLLLKNKKIGVIIIDSIAAPFTVEYENEELKNRAISLRKIGYQLHKLSHRYKLCVICINQVRADLTNNISEIPALGITWEHAITNSIRIYKNDALQKRFIQIMTSPYLPRTTIEFQIHDGGITGIKE